MVGPIKVCGKSLKRIFKVPHSTFDSYLSRHKKGQRRAEHALKGIPRSPNAANNVVVAFIDTFIKENGNYMPDDADKVYMPPGMTMTKLYEEYMELRKDYPVTKGYFSRLYRTHYEKVGIDVSLLIN